MLCDSVKVLGFNSTSRNLVFYGSFCGQDTSEPQPSTNEVWEINMNLSNVTVMNSSFNITLTKTATATVNYLLEHSSREREVMDSIPGQDRPKS